MAYYRQCLEGNVIVKLFILLSLFVTNSYAASLYVAVAANFLEPAQRLAQRYESLQNDKITLIPGSSGKLAAQILQGAPFDIFFSADVATLDKLGDAVLVDSRFVYATGKLVLWTPDLDAGWDILTSTEITRIAIANPKTAPYGQAAQQALQSVDLQDRLADKIILGENITQAYQFTQTGNAQAAFIALSQIPPSNNLSSQFWLIPQTAYEPIQQVASITAQSANVAAAQAFLSFVRSEEGRAIIEYYGYETP